MPKIAIIMRGIPGSGKSTFTKMLKSISSSLGKTVFIHSTDDKFMVNGEYVFNASQLYKYHMQTLSDFKNSLSKGIDVVVIDNTNIKASEYKPYVSAAREAGYVTVAVRFVPSDIQEHFMRQVHGVPIETLIRMSNSLEASGVTIDADAEYVIEPDVFSDDYIKDTIYSIFKK